MSVFSAIGPQIDKAVKADVQAQILPKPIRKPNRRPMSLKGQLRAYVRSCGKVKGGVFRFRLRGSMAADRLSHILLLLQALQFPHRYSVAHGKETEVKLAGNVFAVAWLYRTCGPVGTAKDQALQDAARLVRRMENLGKIRNAALLDHAPNEVEPTSCNLPGTESDREPYLNEQSQPCSEATVQAGAAREVAF